MPNLIWPRALSPQIGAPGLIGRTIHWLGVALAAAVLVTALGFAVDGWSAPLAVGLTLAAVAMALVARGVRYLLARE
jgi:high-affinity Fe2+/Pb2+ permease